MDKVKWDGRPFQGRRTIRWESHGRVYRPGGSTFEPTGSFTAEYTYAEASARIKKVRARHGDVETPYFTSLSPGVNSTMEIGGIGIDLID